MVKVRVLTRYLDVGKLGHFLQDTDISVPWTGHTAFTLLGRRPFPIFLPPKV